MISVAGSPAFTWLPYSGMVIPVVGLVAILSALFERQMAGRCIQLHYLSLASAIRITFCKWCVYPISCDARISKKHERSAGRAGGRDEASVIDQLTPEVVEQLATEAHKQNPSIVDSVSSFYAQHPTLVKSLGATALTIVMAKMSKRAA